MMESIAGTITSLKNGFRILQFRSGHQSEAGWSPAGNRHAINDRRAGRAGEKLTGISRKLERKNYKKLER